MVVKEAADVDGTGQLDTPSVKPVAVTLSLGWTTARVSVTTGDEVVTVMVADRAAPVVLALAVIVAG
ncbi:MAG: hypothetical protein FWD80_03045 [Propionibacteriaceae bacterium]|nr:hypothetical protein [Propionibacteriaceae bacterium]